MADPELGDGGVTAAVTAWVDAYWRPDLPLGEWWRLLAQGGWAFPSWPPTFGGREFDRSRARAVHAALAARAVIGPPAGIAVDMGVPTLFAHATPEQQAAFVPSAVDGSVAWCQLFSEPAAGSDLAAVATRAERDGDTFIVNGQKVWTSGADTAAWGMLLARTDPAVPKRDGLTWMLLDMRQPGVEVRPLVQMNGGAEFCEVFLTDVRVPTANVIGGIGNGWTVARTTLAAERASIGNRPPRGLVVARAGSAGLDRPVGEVIEALRRAQADPAKRFDVMVGHRAMVRLAQEHGVANDPVIRDRVADYWIRSEVHRWNGLRGTADTRAISKLAYALLAARSREVSLAILGAEGMLTGRVQRAGLSAHAPAIGGGTNEIQRNLIAERSLGLPREPG